MPDPAVRKGTHFPELPRLPDPSEPIQRAAESLAGATQHASNIASAGERFASALNDLKATLTVMLRSRVGRSRPKLPLQ